MEKYRLWSKLIFHHHFSLITLKITISSGKYCTINRIVTCIMYFDRFQFHQNILLLARYWYRYQNWCSPTRNRCRISVFNFIEVCIFCCKIQNYMYVQYLCLFVSLLLKKNNTRRSSLTIYLLKFEWRIIKGVKKG